jgi:hypothetical protein
MLLNTLDSILAVVGSGLGMGGGWFTAIIFLIRGKNAEISDPECIAVLQTKKKQARVSLFSLIQRYFGSLQDSSIPFDIIVETTYAANRVIASRENLFSFDAFPLRAIDPYHLQGKPAFLLSTLLILVKVLASNVNLVVHQVATQPVQQTWRLHDAL